MNFSAIEVRKIVSAIDPEGTSLTIRESEFDLKIFAKVNIYRLKISTQVSADRRRHLRQRRRYSIGCTENGIANE